MTGPFPQLPHVDLGNTITDASQAIGGFAAGLVKQKNLARQQALADALGQARIGQMGADTNKTNIEASEIPANDQSKRTLQGTEGARNTADATIGIPAAAGLHTAQTTELEQGNDPADDSQQIEIKSLAPGHIYDPSLTRREANERIKELSQTKYQLDRLGFTQNRFDQGSVLTELNRFNSDPEVRNMKGSIQTYKNSKILVARGAPITQPSLLLDLGQMLGMPGQPNARAVATELTNLLHGSGMAYSQRVEGFAEKLFNLGDHFTMDPESQAAVPEIMQSIMAAKMKRYDQLRGDLHSRVSGVLGVQLPDRAIGENPYDEIRQELNTPVINSGAGAASAGQQQQGGAQSPAVAY